MSISRRLHDTSTGPDKLVAESARHRIALNRPHRHRNIFLLGLAQLLAWGSSYYLAAMLAKPMADDLGLPINLIFALFSGALIVSALIGPIAGSAIDRFGGRGVLMLACLLFAGGLALLADAEGPVQLGAGWGLIGLGMGTGLYEGAFATLVQLYGAQSRRPITAITLLGGLASTVCWPLTAGLEAALGWRATCLVWAGVHLLVILPFYALLTTPAGPTGLRADGTTSHTDEAATQVSADTPSQEPPEALEAPLRTAALLSLAFALTWFISTAMAAHLPRLLEAQGLAPALALALAGLVGVAQVAGRLLEFVLHRRLKPLLSARLAAAMHPLGASLFLLIGAPVGALFTVLHGAGNGILTIAKGTLPLLLFGPRGYGLRQGLIMVPARFAQALAPLAFGLALDDWGAQALWLCVALGLICLAALIALPNRST
jgi:MFS family permease